MKIVNTGYNFRHPHNFALNRPQGSGDYMLLILRSPAYFILDGVTYTTDGNSAIIYQKDTPQIYGASGQEYINDWVHFEADESDVAWMTSIGLRFDCILNFANVMYLSELIMNIFEELYSKNKNHIFQLVLQQVLYTKFKKQMMIKHIHSKLVWLKSHNTKKITKKLFLKDHLFVF